ncbi:MAG TPA: hypothetical protein VN706_04015, partial [Gemmatimonadaceae bacterium]|nr:hypothetical protein [Gemmatimonadaceae bacterium]
MFLAFTSGNGRLRVVATATLLATLAACADSSTSPSSSVGSHAPAAFAKGLPGGGSGGGGGGVPGGGGG